MAAGAGAGAELHQGKGRGQGPCRVLCWPARGFTILPSLWNLPVPHVQAGVPAPSEDKGGQGWEREGPARAQHRLGTLLMTLPG